MRIQLGRRHRRTEVPRKVSFDNQVIELTKSEFDIVAFLSRHPGQVFDREMIYEKLWGLDRDGDNKNVTELIRRIRNKIREHTDREFIETVWGCGYRWAAKIKRSLFKYLIISLTISIILSIAVQDAAQNISDNIQLKYTDSSKLYEYQNGYSQLFGDVPQIPDVSPEIMTPSDRIAKELCDFISSWCILFFTIFRLSFYRSHYSINAG